jgi:riboflavin synthase
MFGGIVEGTGTVITREARPSAVRLVIDAGPLAEGVGLGDSVAHNGCCLTVVGLEGSCLHYDLLEETERVTNLGRLRPGDRVNLERALPACARIGGHFVTGHVDTTGCVRQFERAGADWKLVLACAPPWMRYVVPKGCLAVDGMSLTVVDVAADFFSIWIIPHTRESTCLVDRRPGDPVNLEFDLLAKYVEKILAASRNGA